MTSSFMFYFMFCIYFCVTEKLIIYIKDFVVVYACFYISGNFYAFTAYSSSIYAFI